MKRIILVFVIIAGLFLFANKPIHQKSIEKEWGREIMKLEVNGYTFEIELENNTSAKHLKNMFLKKKEYFL